MFPARFILLHGIRPGPDLDQCCSGKLFSVLKSHKELHATNLESRFPEAA